MSQLPNPASSGPLWIRKRDRGKISQPTTAEKSHKQTYTDELTHSP